MSEISDIIMVAPFKFGLQLVCVNPLEIKPGIPFSSGNSRGMYV